MLGRLLDKLFRRRPKTATAAAATRPSSPPPPVVPARLEGGPSMPPPPPPPPVVPAATATRAPSQDTSPHPVTGDPEPSEPGTPDDLASPMEHGVPEVPQSQEESGSTTETKVRLVLADGTTATPGLDPESEERLKYILDNIVPPSDGPST